MSTRAILLRFSFMRKPLRERISLKLSCTNNIYVRQTGLSIKINIAEGDNKRANWGATLTFVAESLKHFLRYQDGVMQQQN